MSRRERRRREGRGDTCDRIILGADIERWCDHECRVIRHKTSCDCGKCRSDSFGGRWGMVVSIRELQILWSVCNYGKMTAEELRSLEVRNRLWGSAYLSCFPFYRSQKWLIEVLFVCLGIDLWYSGSSVKNSLIQSSYNGRKLQKTEWKTWLSTECRRSF
jgi:hypothetical protein